jgi:hypothetical protein
VSDDSRILAAAGRDNTVVRTIHRPMARKQSLKLHSASVPINPRLVLDEQAGITDPFLIEGDTRALVGHDAALTKPDGHAIFCP